MKNYTMFNYNFLFSDHMAKVSNQAKLYYIALNFFAINGFVPNPLQVLDSLGYDKGVFNELVCNGELLTIPDRSEIFIASYFVHNKGMTCYSWRSTPYAVYWENKLFVKKNGVCTFKPQGLEDKDTDVSDPLDKIEEPDPNEGNKNEWDKLVGEISNDDDDDALPFEK